MASAGDVAVALMKSEQPIWSATSMIGKNLLESADKVLQWKEAEMRAWAGHQHPAHGSCHGSRLEFTELLRAPCLGVWFHTPVAMEAIGTPDSDYLDGWANTFGKIVYFKYYIWGSSKMEANSMDSESGSH